MANRRGGPKPGAKIKKLTDQDKWNASKKSRAAEGEWRVVRGVLRLVKKK